MPTIPSSEPLSLAGITAHYHSREWTPRAVIEECFRRIDACADPALWIFRLPKEEVMAQSRRAEQRLAAGERQPLLGVPFAIKDNIDVAGHPTTAACPDFSYIPK